MVDMRKGEVSDWCYRTGEVWVMARRPSLWMESERIGDLHLVPERHGFEMVGIARAVCQVLTGSTNEHLTRSLRILRSWNHMSR